MRPTQYPRMPAIGDQGKPPAVPCPSGDRLWSDRALNKYQLDPWPEPPPRKREPPPAPTPTLLPRSMREMQEADERKALQTPFEAYWADCERMADEMLAVRPLPPFDPDLMEIQGRIGDLDFARTILCALTLAAAAVGWFLYLTGAR